MKNIDTWLSEPDIHKKNHEEQEVNKGCEDEYESFLSECLQKKANDYNRIKGNNITFKKGGIIPLKV